jgi:hypothetical protein
MARKKRVKRAGGGVVGPLFCTALDVPSRQMRDQRQRVGAGGVSVTDTTFSTATDGEG